MKKCSKLDGIGNKYLISIGCKYVFLWFIYIIKVFTRRGVKHVTIFVTHISLVSIRQSKVVVA